MAIVRVEKTANYTVMSNYHLREKDMSLKAIGLLSFMLSLPDSWDYSVSGLTAVRKESRSTINSILQELENFGYLERRKLRKNGVFQGVEYIVHEKPCTKNYDTVAPCTKNPHTEKPYTENCTQINTKEISTYKNISKKESRKSFNDIIDCNFENTEIRELLRAFLQLRFAKGKTTIDKSLQLLLDKLKKMSKNNDDIAIKIIKQSLEKGWTDFYELKDKKTKPAEKKKVKTNQFNNFHQREYTKKELDEWEIRMLTSK